MLTDRLQQDFHHDGYLLVKAIYRPEEMHEIVSWTDEIAAYPEIPCKYMMYFGQNRLPPGKKSCAAWRILNLP